MKLRKKTLVGLIGVAVIGGVCLQYAPPPPPPSPSGQAQFESMPPIPVKYWVQKLATPRPDSSNVAMQIKYVSDVPLPASLTVFQGSDSVIFHDDGVAPDITARDGIYAAYIKEDIPAFLSQVAALDNALTAKGSFIDFQGHFGNVVTEMPHFDVLGFNDGFIEELQPTLLNGAECGTELKKQNSLFITARSVTEDPARTFNPLTGVGNPAGSWTFGHMISGLVGLSPLPGAKRTLLKNWLTLIAGPADRSATVPTGFSSPSSITLTASPRTDVIRFLIEPWLRQTGLNPNTSVTVDNWQDLWDQTDEQKLLDYAPFKLTAIANRLDLRGNNAYYNNRSMSRVKRGSYLPWCCRMV